MLANSSKCSAWCMRSWRVVGFVAEAGRCLRGPLLPASWQVKGRLKGVLIVPTGPGTSSADESMPTCCKFQLLVHPSFFGHAERPSAPARQSCGSVPRNSSPSCRARRPTRLMLPGRLPLQ